MESRTGKESSDHGADDDASATAGPPLHLLETMLPNLDNQSLWLCQVADNILFHVAAQLGKLLPCEQSGEQRLVTTRITASAKAGPPLPRTLATGGVAQPPPRLSGV